MRRPHALVRDLKTHRRSGARIGEAMHSALLHRISELRDDMHKLWLERDKLARDYGKQPGFKE